MNPTTRIPLEELEAQGPFLRRIARALVREEADAEDLVQDTWVVALQREPAPAETLRDWLARLARNLAKSRRRSAARRARREGIAASADVAEDGPDGTEVAERVLTAVLALNDPYREVVLQRYYQELPSKEIARRSGAELRTVETRLRRARHRLRERLDGDFGGRAMWSVALGLLAGVESPAKLGTGALAVAAAAAIAVVGGVTWRLVAASSPDETPQVAVVAPLAAESADTAPRSVEENGDEQGGAPKVAAGAPELPFENSEPPALPFPPPVFPPVDVDSLSTEKPFVRSGPCRLIGRVEGGPFEEPWVAVIHDGKWNPEAGGIVAPCSETGEFSLEVPADWGAHALLIAVAHGRAPASKRVRLGPGAQTDARVRIDRTGELAAGVVRDGAGAPLAGARVQLWLEKTRAQRELLVGPHALNLDGSVRRARGEVTTDEHGFFELLGMESGRHRAIVLPGSVQDDLPMLVLIGDKSGKRVVLPEAALDLNPELEELELLVLGAEAGRGEQPITGSAVYYGPRRALKEVERIIKELMRVVQDEESIDDWLSTKTATEKLIEDEISADPLPPDGRLRVLFDPRADVELLFLREGQLLDFAPRKARPDPDGITRVLLKPVR